MKIAVDFDSTLADTLKVVLDLINFKRGTKLVRDNVVSWDWKENAQLWGWDHPQDAEDDFWMIYDLFDTTHLRRAIPPTDPTACGSVKWLIKRGHDVRIVTSNKPQSEVSIRSWLFGHGLELPLDIIGRKSAREKAEMDFDVFIDDSPSLAEAIATLNGGMGKTLFLVPQPYNTHVLPSLHVVTEFTWRRALDFFEQRGL